MQNSPLQAPNPESTSQTNKSQQNRGCSIKGLIFGEMAIKWLESLLKVTHHELLRLIDGEDSCIGRAFHFNANSSFLMQKIIVLTQISSFLIQNSSVQ